MLCLRYSTSAVSSIYYLIRVPKHIKVSILATDFTEFFAFFVYIRVASWIFFYDHAKS